MATKCATQHITVSLPSGATTISSGPDPAVAALSSSRALLPCQQQQQQQQQQHTQVQCQMVIECVVVSVWDDERRRLLGCTAGRSPALDPAPAPAELCCVYWDNLSVEITRQPAASTGMLFLPCLPCFHCLRANKAQHNNDRLKQD